MIILYSLINFFILLIGLGVGAERVHGTPFFIQVIEEKYIENGRKFNKSKFALTKLKLKQIFSFIYILK